MTKRQAYVERLAALEPAGADEVATFLVAHSHLPGPRGNLELAHAFADWAPAGLVDALAAVGVPRPAAGGHEFVDFCVALALGERLARADDPALVALLRSIATDERWRLREAVATGLQRVGDHDLPRLCALVLDWAADPDPLVQRAAAAAICEPRLLTCAEGAHTAIRVCGRTTSALAARPAGQRRDPSVRVLRQALGYCWSVAVAADPGEGLPAFEALQASSDPDVAWIVRENLGKARLQRVFADRAGGLREQR